MDVLHLLAAWTHTLGFVIVMGYYGVLGRMLLPALERSLEPAASARALVALGARARPLLLLSVGLFVVTGTYLLVASDEYMGLGTFDSAWTVLMLVKHVVVAALVVLALLADRETRRLASASDGGVPGITRRLGFLAEAATASGALAILLTVAAQAG